MSSRGGLEPVRDILVRVLTSIAERHEAEQRRQAMARRLGVRAFPNQQQGCPLCQN